MAKVALVTGGARRVGAQVARTLAQAGYDVALTCHQSRRSADALAREITDLGRRAAVIEADFQHPAADAVVFDAFTATFDRLDVLVNNASIFEPSPIGQITLAQFEQNMAVNARAPLMLIQRFAPMLGEHYSPMDPSSTGRIINFIDIHVMGQPLKGWMAYNCSKAALMEVTMTAALELAPKVTVNAIAPGVVAWAESYTPEQREAYMRRVPLARPGTPDDAAAAVLYLARDAHYCTAQILRLDGGRLYT
jgi:pteridine reductase